MKSERFHHGNLREQLLTVAMQTLNEKGIEGLSLRNIAQISDVSSAAPYRHFKNRDALISALAKKGYDNLSASYEVAINTNQSDEKRLCQACQAYLECAEENPHLFKLMFIDMDFFHSSPDDPVTQKYGYQLFEQLVTALIPAGEPDYRNREIAISCWALLHGFATLHMSGRLAAIKYDKEQVISAVIALAKSPENGYP